MIRENEESENYPLPNLNLLPINSLSKRLPLFSSLVLLARIPSRNYKSRAKVARTILNEAARLNRCPQWRVD